MSVTRYGMGLLGIVGLIAATLAAATIRLVLIDPVTVADAVTEQDITPVVRGNWPGSSSRPFVGSCGTL